MDKTAQTAHPIHPLLAERWSPVGFSDRPVEPWKLVSLFEAARWAPSCFNEQPWAFVVATRDSPGDYQRLLSCLVEKNQQWARTAPVLVMTAAKRTFDRNGKENRHAFHDVGLAMGNLVLQATAMGLFAHQMAGILPEHAREVLCIPEGFDSVAGVAIGYLADMASLPPDLRDREARPRTRKPISGFVHFGEWSRPPAFVEAAKEERPPKT